MGHAVRVADSWPDFCTPTLRVLLLEIFHLRNVFPLIVTYNALYHLCALSHICGDMYSLEATVALTAPHNFASLSCSVSSAFETEVPKPHHHLCLVLPNIGYGC